MMKTGLIFIILALMVSVYSEPIKCHYTCETCVGQEFYQCTLCNNNRGEIGSNNNISGMCYCNEETDENYEGACMTSNEFNYNNKTLIASFIALSLLLSLLVMLLTGSRYFLLKTIEDVQEISIIVLINLYYPQQFDIFLSYLYRFNISSYTFQSMTLGTLFMMNDSELLESSDGDNIQGKYKLVYKTANFFANQFTWLIVTLCILVAAIALRCVRSRMKKKQEQQDTSFTTEDKVKESISISSSRKDDPADDAEIAKKRQLKAKNQRKSSVFSIINKIYNIVWYNVLIAYFYLSLTEININIFTQISNLTFSSPFSVVGVYFSAVFLAGEIIVLFILVLKVKEEAVKPEWMRDYAFSAAIYLLRTNYKSVTKYFWIISCTKKIFVALFITILYSQPRSSIIAVCCIQVLYAGIALYCQPFERRYIRIHFYIMESIKIIIFFSMINFSEKYLGIIQMVQITKIKFIMLTFMFGFNFIYIALSLIIERKIYVRLFKRKFCADKEGESGKLGYYSEGKIYLYEYE